MGVWIVLAIVAVLLLGYLVVALLKPEIFRERCMSGIMATCLLFLVVLLAAVPSLGRYMARVYAGEAVWPTRLLGGLEQGFYRLAGIRAEVGMSWKQYLAAILLLSGGGFVLLYALLLAQGELPWNPRHVPGLSPSAAFAIAVSYVTRTDWLPLRPEAALSPLVQTLGLAVQNLVSAATGMAVLVAFIRGLAGKERRELGNFWADLVRSVLYILLPLALLLALSLSALGVAQTTQTVRHVAWLGHPGVSQTLSLGPVASQTAISLLGSNGGDLFTAGAAHPFANPNASTNLLQAIAMLLIPAGLCATYGRLVGDRRQGYAMLALMTAFTLVPLGLTLWLEMQGNPRLGPLGVDAMPGFLQPGGNMEGKEARFGITGSMLWTIAGAAGANASSNAALSSLLPLSGLMPLAMMMLGEVAFGGVGTGLVHLLLYTLITVFIAGLMVGRTPEYMGKKIQAFEMKMASVAILVPAATILIGTAFASMMQAGRFGLMHRGPHGFSEMLFAFSSAAMNSGGAFSGQGMHSPFYDFVLGMAMLVGRFWMMVPVLAIAGSLGMKKPIPPSKGTLPTHTPLFVFMLAAIVLLTGVLTFIPALSLGPIVEALHLRGTP